MPTFLKDKNFYKFLEKIFPFLLAVSVPIFIVFAVINALQNPDSSKNIEIVNSPEGEFVDGVLYFDSKLEITNITPLPTEPVYIAHTRSPIIIEFSNEINPNHVEVSITPPIKFRKVKKESLPKRLHIVVDEEWQPGNYLVSLSLEGKRSDYAYTVIQQKISNNDQSLPIEE